MLKCKGIDSPLPHGILITRIMQYGGVELYAKANPIMGLDIISQQILRKS